MQVGQVSCDWVISQANGFLSSKVTPCLSPLHMGLVSFPLLCHTETQPRDSHWDARIILFEPSDYYTNESDKTLLALSSQIEPRIVYLLQ